MKWRSLAVLGVAVMALAACETSSSNTNAGGKVLIAEPTTGVTFSDDFNPYDTNSVASSMGTRSLVNEPLIEFDQLDPTAAGTHYWLATAFQFQNGGKDLQITVRQNVKFSDGSAVGPADVAATSKMLQNPKTGASRVAPQASDPPISGNTVPLRFQSPQFPALWSILGTTYV